MLLFSLSRILNFVRNDYEMWRKNFGKFVKAAFYKPGKNILTKKNFVKRTSKVTFSDFKQLTVRLFPKFWERFPKRCVSCPQVFFDKNCVVLRKTVIPLFFWLRAKNYRSFAKSFHHDCLKFNILVQTKSYWKMVKVRKVVIY